MLKMKNETIDMHSKTISDLNLQIFSLNNTITAMKCGFHDIHKPCEDKFNEVDSELYDREQEVKQLKKNMNKMKNIKTHEEIEKQMFLDSEHKKKFSDFIKKYTALENKNKKLRDEISSLVKSNKVLSETISNLQEEIKDTMVIAKSKDEIQVEQKKIMSENRIKYKCEFCENEFVQKRYLKVHIMNAHEIKVLTDINDNENKLVESLQ